MGGFLYNKKNELMDKDSEYTKKKKEDNNINNEKLIHEINMKYKIKYYYVKIFGSKFVTNNKNKAKFIFEEKEYELEEYFQIPDEYNKDILDIKLKMINKIEDLSSMFEGCADIVSINNISYLINENIININSMFCGCSSLSSLPDISNWNIINVRDMSYLFTKCSSLKSIPDISIWKTNNLENIKSIFRGCFNIKYFPDISKWNTSKVKDMSYMF